MNLKPKRLCALLDDFVDWHRVTKLLRIMQLTAIVLLSACLTSYAVGFSQRVTLSVKNEPIQKIFKEVSRQTGISFIYNEEMFSHIDLISIDVKNITVKEALDICLKNQPFEYSLEGQIIMIIPTTLGLNPGLSPEGFSPLFPPPIKISGTVVGINNQPLAGATIKVKGKGVMAVTDEKGYFELNAEEGSTLIVTYVGFNEREFKIRNSSQIKIELDQTNSNMDTAEVVINTGYQKINKERFVGSYSQLDSATFHSRPGTSIKDRLDGMVSGILFNRKDSQFPFQIRGISTLGSDGGSTDPLIILDNFPVDENFSIGRINPNDIESISILKDAAAASIWGARAGNGVIVITTKKAKYNQKPQVSLSSNVLIREAPDQFFVPRISPADFIDIEKLLFENGFYNRKFRLSNKPPVSPAVEIFFRESRGIISPEEAAEQINALKQNDLRNTLENDIYRPAVQQQHYLSVSGGNRMLSYLLSLGYNRNLNDIRGSKPSNQYTINSNFTLRPVKNLEIEAGINYILSDAANASFNIPPAAGFAPYLKFRDENGNSAAIPYRYRQGYTDTAGAGQLLDWSYRPLDEIKYADNKVSTKASRLLIAATYTLTKWLKARMNYQYASTNGNIRDNQNLNLFETRNLINRFTNPYENNPNLRNPVPIGDILFLSNSVINNQNVRAGLNIEKVWGEHQLSGMISGELSDSKGTANAQTIFGYRELNVSFRPNMDFYNYYPILYAASEFTVETIPNTFSTSEAPNTRLISLLANANYTYKNKYYAYLSARRDGANIFGVNTNNRWKPLWSAGLGWEISKEKFFNVGWLSYLKLKANYGYTGNVNNNITGKLVIRNIPIPARFTDLYFSSLTTPPSPDLRWEKVRTIDLGVDFQFLRGKIAGSFDLYEKKSSDVITSEPLAPSTGMGRYPLNSASLKTKGFDFDLRSGTIKIGALKYNTGIGLSYAKTVVLEYNTQTRYRAEDFVHYAINPTPGAMLYSLASYRWAGLDSITGDPLGVLDGKITKDYIGIFSDSLNNQVYHGSSLPLYSAFLTNQISWKDLSLSFNITGRFDYYFREPALNLNYTEAWSGQNYLEDYYRRWQKPGDEKLTQIPSMTYPNPDDGDYRESFYSYSSIHVKRADNIRLQFINLSYNWNNKTIKRLPIQSAKLFLYVNDLNLILWRADDSYYDPEYNAIGIIGMGGPPKRSWTIGISLNL